jgi:hypothetical protein
MVTLSAPIAQAAIASYNILGASFNFSQGSMVLQIQPVDANGNVLGPPQGYLVGPTVAAARIAALGPQLQTDYTTDSGA